MKCLINVMERSTPEHQIQENAPPLTSWLGDPTASAVVREAQCVEALCRWPNAQREYSPAGHSALNRSQSSGIATQLSSPRTLS